MTRRITYSPCLIACAVAAGTLPAHAGVFTWFVGNGLWENPAMWNGPVGQYPDSIVDSATISGGNSAATLGQNMVVGTLSVLNGASLYSSASSMFVNGDMQISGFGSTATVNDTPALRDLDTDTLTITNGLLVMYDGLAQFDEALIINGGGVLGTGTIEMNSTTGNVDINGGAIWAAGAVSQGDTLRITRTNSGTSRLDWSDPSSSLIVWDAKSLINELPYTGSLAGRISVSGSAGTARFASLTGFVAGPGSVIELAGAGSQSTARVEAPVVDSYGLVDVSGYGVIDAPIVVLRGEVAMDAGAFFTLPADLLVFDSLSIGASGGGAKIQMARPNSTLNITGGLTSIDLGAGSAIDLDGGGSKTVNIAQGSTLSLGVESIDLGGFPSFGGTLNINGTLHVPVVGAGATWRSNGEIRLGSGTITGRMLVNAGTIRGNGYIWPQVSNSGEIIAEGGNLEVRSVDIDGDDAPNFGTLRAQAGNLAVNMQAGGDLSPFVGSIYVGDGAGVREVLQMDVNLYLKAQNGVRGSMRLDSGVVMMDDFSQRGDLWVGGTSRIRTTGGDSSDLIGFDQGGRNTVVGTLEVQGETWFMAGALFEGEGTIRAMSNDRRTVFHEGSDLGDISFISGGEIAVSSLLQNAHATMGALTLESTADLRIGLNNFTDMLTAEKLVVRDRAALAGTLSVGWSGDGPAPTGETVTVLSAGDIVGGFAAVDDSGLGANRRAFVTVDSSTVRVFVTCSADINADGAADFFDISLFLTRFNAMDPQADLNQDGIFNFFDVSMFIFLFNQGC